MARLVEHEFDNSGEWKQNQSFIDQVVPYSFFDHMHELHYTKPNYGPFLSGLRANRWWDEEEQYLEMTLLMI